MIHSFQSSATSLGPNIQNKLARDISDSEGNI